MGPFFPFLALATVITVSHGRPERKDLLYKSLNLSPGEEDSEALVEPETLLICVPLSVTLNATTGLAKLGITADIIYTSKHEAASCVVAHGPGVGSAAAELQELGLPLELVSSIPAASKLVPSLFAPSVGEEGGQVLPQTFHQTENPVDGLVVTFALGSRESWKDSGPAWLRDHVVETARRNVNEPPQWLARRLKRYGRPSKGFSPTSCAWEKLSLLAVPRPTYHSSRGAPPVLHIRGISRLHHSAGETCTLAVVAALAAQSDVTSIEPLAPIEVRNGRAARLIQTSANVASPYASSTPIWNLGLSGAGQVLGLADTGLDTASCFFSSSATGQTPVSRSSNIAVFVMSQPKVVQYVSYVDDQDEAAGHGTHVAATAVGERGASWPDYSVDTSKDPCPAPDCTVPDYYGNCASNANAATCGSMFADGGSYEGACADTCYCSTGFFTHTGSVQGSGQTCGQLIEDSRGVAFGAKMAFFDLGNPSGGLVTPASIENDLFPAAYNAGARVHSNSWGSSTVFNYANQDLQVDRYSYNNPDVLIIFAAGNDGVSGVSGTLGSPAHSKNALAVSSPLLRTHTQKKELLWCSFCIRTHIVRWVLLRLGGGLSHPRGTWILTMLLPFRRLGRLQTDASRSAHVCSFPLSVTTLYPASVLTLCSMRSSYARNLCPPSPTL